MTDTLLSLQEVAPNAILDVRYATTNNLTSSAIYDEVNPRLMSVAAEALQAVVQEVESHDLRLVIWDAYRPKQAHEKLRAYCGDERYVREDSNHCKGLAIDATLATADGAYLNMGTDYDDFSTAAHSDYMELSSEQLSNRQLLKELFERHRFSQWPYEWWHFDFAK